MSKGFVIFLVAVGGVVLLMQGPPSGDRNDGRSAQAAVDAATAKTAMPASQRAFVAAVEAGIVAYRAADNELAAGGVRATRAKAVCQALSGTRVNNWTGTVYDLSSNGDGKGVLEIQIADDMYISTWNNALSDISDQTLIDPDSDLFSRLATLSEGQPVTFSGTFLADDVDCVREISLSLSGSMTEPEYLMQFHDVQPR